MANRVYFSCFRDDVWSRGTGGTTDAALEQSVNKGTLSKSTLTYMYMYIKPQIIY